MSSRSCLTAVSSGLEYSSLVTVRMTFWGCDILEDRLIPQQSHPPPQQASDYSCSPREDLLTQSHLKNTVIMLSDCLDHHYTLISFVKYKMLA